MKRAKRIAASLLMAALLCLEMAGCSSYENPADLPFGSDGWQGQTAEEVVAALEAAGFTNIQENIKETSSADDAGKVTQITVDGKNVFRAGDRHEGTEVVEVTYYSMKRFEAEMEVEVSGDAGLPVFTVNTNLPNGTKLELTLEDGAGYSEKQTAVVKDGQAVSDMFWDSGNYLTGDYTLSVVMEPGEQNATVRHEIGENGEALAGKLAQTSGDSEGQYLHLEQAYTSDYVETEKIDQEEVIALLEQAAASGFGDNYSVSAEGKTFVINVWQEGAAACAALAAQGVPSAVDQWYAMVDSACSASESLQAVLTGAGYGDCVAVLQVLNDQNRENTLMTTCFGAATYNSVE